MYKDYTEGCSLGCSYPNYKEGCSLGYNFAQPQEEGAQSVIGPSKFFGVSKNLQDKKEELSDSENNNILQNIQRKRDTDMSYLLTVALKNEIYIAADSRSTITYPDGNQTYSDNYQKIVIIPDTNIVVASTGLNSFNGKSFRDIVYSLKGNSQKELFADLVSKIKKYEILYNQKAFIICASVYENNEDTYTKTIYRTTDNNFELLSNNIGCYSAGAVFANNITDSLNITEIRRNPQENIQKIMQNIISLSSVTDNTAGGPIQMVRITPEKAEWVDGFKPDFIK